MRVQTETVYRLDAEDSLIVVPHDTTVSLFPNWDGSTPRFVLCLGAAHIDMVRELLAALEALAGASVGAGER